MRNKKGQVAFIAVIILIGVLAVVWYSATHPYPWTEKMGERQNAMLESYSAAEAARQFVKDAVTISAKAIRDTRYCPADADLPPVKTQFKKQFETDLEAKLEPYLDKYTALIQEDTGKYPFSLDIYHTLYVDVRSGKIWIESFPIITQDSEYQIDDDGNILRDELGRPQITSVTYEDVITISSEEFDFAYFADPHFVVEIPCKEVST